VVRRARVKPAETLCIGDEIRDIEAARAAGLASGAVVWGYNRRETLAERAPTWMFETPDDVAAQLAA
jgi:phosphoglycolate phosphatase